MDKLSVVIITYNEEKNIGRAIASVKDIADEIIVVDSFSEDKTEQICLKNDVRFEQRKWTGYSDQKNYANSLSKCKYIFSLDADEAVDNQLLTEIQKHKEIGFEGVYIVNRLVNYCGKWIKHSTWYPDRKIRIFPKESAAWQGEFVHEELSFEKQLSQIELDGHLEHYTYYNFLEHQHRADKYSVLTAKKMHKNGKKAGILKPYASAFVRFLSMFVFNLGFLDGYMGFKIAQISARSNILKYKELRRLNKQRDLTS